MLFDEDPKSLISQTIANFHGSSDLNSLSRISSSLSTLRSARSLRLQSQHQSLATLSRKLHHLSQQHADELESHDAGQHAAQILALDTEKFRIAKGASELEIEGERLSGELRALRRTLEGLERDGIEGERGRDGSEDETLLKLKLYRSLGIDAEQDPATGEFNRAVVRNTAKGDAQVVNINSKLDRSLCAGHFWGSM